MTTCLYSEYWVRYSKYLERQRDNGPAKAREVLHRATSIYCKRGTPVHLELAGFEERHGDIEESRRVRWHEDYNGHRATRVVVRTTFVDLSGILWRI